MATHYTDIAAGADSVSPADRVSGRKLGGQLCILHATYTMKGTEAASGDTIEIGDFPVGAIPLPELFRISNDAAMGGSSLAIPKIGDAGDDDRYTASSITIHSTNAETQAITTNAAAHGGARWTVTDATKRVIATFSRTNAPTAGKKIAFLFPYILP